MLEAHNLGMTKGDYVFYTMDMLPDEEILNPESIWKGNDGRDDIAREAFESVFHVRFFVSLHEAHIYSGSVKRRRGVVHSVIEKIHK